MSKGFTLLELIFVIGAVIVIAALTLPVGVNFYETQVADESTEGILKTLRRAQAYAIFQKNDSSFGVKFLSGSYVLFQGVSYAVRDTNQDEVFDLGAGISIQGIGEVSFAKLTGTPSASGTITIAAGEHSTDISINSLGNIEKQ